MSVAQKMIQEASEAHDKYLIDVIESVYKQIKSDLKEYIKIHGPTGTVKIYRIEDDTNRLENFGGPEFSLGCMIINDGNVAKQELNKMLTKDGFVLETKELNVGLYKYLYVYINIKQSLTGQESSLLSNNGFVLETTQYQNGINVNINIGRSFFQ